MSRKDVPAVKRNESHWCAGPDEHEHEGEW